MSSLLKLLINSGVVTGHLRARLRAVKRSAGIVAGLAAAALIASAVGVAAIALAGFSALRLSMADYQAALIVGGIFILLAALCALATVSTVRRAVRGPQVDRSPVAVPVPEQPLVARQRPYLEDPLVRQIVAGVQLPAIVSALALGIVAGRTARRSRRD